MFKKKYDKIHSFLFENWSRLTGQNLLKISISKFVPFGGYSNMVFFFIAGAFLFQYRDKINCYIEGKAWRKCIPLLLFTVGTAGLVFIKYCDTGLISWGGSYISSGYSRVSTVLIAFGLYFILVRWKIGKIGSFLAKYVGTATMGIYFIHRPILVLFQGQFRGYYENYGSLGLNILKTIIAVAISTLIVMGVKKLPLIKEIVK